MGGLAITYQLQKRFVEAVAMHQQADRMLQQVEGRDHPSTLSNMHDLVWALRHLGNKADALALMRDYYEKQRKALGADHPNTRITHRTINKWQSGNSIAKLKKTLCLT
jgi:hypothetical protein